MSNRPNISKEDLNHPLDSNLPISSWNENPGPSTDVIIENPTTERKSAVPKKRLWYTKQTVDPSNRDLYIATILKEMIIYFIFLTILCTVAFGMTSNSTYYLRKSMSALLIDAKFNEKGENFRKATQIHDFWNFAEKVLIDALYWDVWHSAGDAAGTNDKHSKILYENELLGLPRLRQLRVRNDSCEVQEYFRRMYNSCYDSFSRSAEDTKAFGPGRGTPWTYHSPSELGGSSHTGLVTSYPPGGYYLDLKLERNKTIDILADLKTKGWVDRGTRVVFLDLTVYNANVNLFCIIKLVMEFPPTGGVVPSWTFYVVNIVRYSSKFDYFILVCEVVFVLFVIFYTAEEMYEAIILKKKYLFILWSYVDLIILTISWVSIFMNLVRFIIANKFLKDLVENTDKYCDFEFIGYWHFMFSNSVALIVLFAWLKLFKYMGFNKTMTQLGRSLARSANDVAGFSVMFLIAFFAFVQLGYLLFGTQVRDFSTLGNSTFALLRIILGDFDFDSLQNASPVLGPMFFFFYIFFIFFILLNMFLAIINVTYIEIKSEINARREDFELVRYLKKLISRFREFIGRPDNTKNMNFPEGKISHKEIKENLKKCNFSDLEIDMFFAKYDLSGDGYLTEEEVSRMTTDLYGAPVFSGNDAQLHMAEELGTDKSISEVSREEFEVLQERVLQVEVTLEVVVDKIQAMGQMLHDLNSE